MNNNEHPTMQQLAEIVFEYRKFNKLSLAELSMIIFENKGEKRWLSNLETGKLKSITTDRLDRVLKAIKYTTEIKPID